MWAMATDSHSMHVFQHQQILQRLKLHYELQPTILAFTYHRRRYHRFHHL